MKENENWEGYISGYITRYGLEPLFGSTDSEVLRMEGVIVLSTGDIRVSLYFGSSARQILRRVSFKGRSSETVISLSFEEEGGKLYRKDNRFIVEDFLNMALVHGWTEQVISVRGVIIRTKIHRGCNGKRHFCTLHHRANYRQRLMYRLGIGVTDVTTPHKGALQLHEERLNSVTMEDGRKFLLDFGQYTKKVDMKPDI